MPRIVSYCITSHIIHIITYHHITPHHATTNADCPAPMHPCTLHMPTPEQGPAHGRDPAVSPGRPEGGASAAAAPNAARVGHGGLGLGGAALGPALADLRPRGGQTAGAWSIVYFALWPVV